MFMCGELFAQGHRLCNNSNGFRLTKQYIQDDEFITSEAPELSAKLESGADLTADEDGELLAIVAEHQATALAERCASSAPPGSTALKPLSATASRSPAACTACSMALAAGVVAASAPRRCE